MGKSISELYMDNSIDNTAGKIREKLNAVRNKRKVSAKRCIWEMMQNAKDVFNPKYGGVSIEFEIADKHTFIFRHNGLYFGLKDVTCLIQQVSSKSSTNEDENVTGMFGTGFISTHLIADIIDVKSVLLDSDGRFRRFSLRLDRSGTSKEELAPRIKDTMIEFAKLENDSNGIRFPFVDDYNQHTETDFDTSFIYRIESESQLQLALLGINDLVNTLPVTLINLPTIKSVRVINRLEDTDICYTCSRENKYTNVVLSTITNGGVPEKYLTYTTPNVSLSIKIREENNQWYAIKRDDNLPVLLRDFPLIGSHKFYFPYFLNGFRFIPTEPRDDIYIHGASDDKLSVMNRSIIDKAVENALIFNQWLIDHNIHNRYLLASSRIPKSTESWDEETSAPWIKNLQAHWRKQLLQERLVETDDGTDFLINISVPSFTPTSTKEVNETFYNLLHDQYIGRGVLPILKHLHGWLDVVRPEYETWGTKLKYEKDDFLSDLSSFKNIAALSAKISKTHRETIDWLNSVYKFLVEQNMLNEFDNYAIIPNQRGDFKFLKELYSDHTSRIPAILKDIYNSVNRDNDTIQHMLMDEEVEATVFGNTLRAFSLKEMINKLNEYVKSGTNIQINNDYIDIRSKVAYSILSLYPKTSDQAFLTNRKSIYDFCSAYRSMSAYTVVDTTEMDLWKEADNYWFDNSYKDIVSKTNVTNIASSFFTTTKTQEETLSWLNLYIQFYRDHSHGDLIKEKAVFPNQQLNLKKLSELRYDSDIPEVFKDLANVAYDPNSQYDVYRHQLIHPVIKGYEQHNPLTIKEIYEYTKKRFEDSNDTTKEAIARHVITILVKSESGEPEEKKLYDFATVISGHTFSNVKYVENHSGFNWGFAQEFYIKLLANRIATSINLEGLKKLSSTFTDDNSQKSDIELTQWVDSFIEFLHSYKNKKYWPIITDKDSGIGIWLNQNKDFCKFQDVREDKVQVPELIELAVQNCHINKDFKAILFTLDSSKTSYLETEAVELSEVATYIDNKIKEYDGNKQEVNFRSLIFSIGKICSLVKNVEDLMEYYKAYKNSLIVWSLGEGTTMDLVGSIVQHGDEKLKTVKDILDGGTSVEDLKDLNEVLHGCPADKFDKVKALINKLASEQTILNKNDEIPLASEDEMDVVVVPKTQEIEDVEDFEGKIHLVRADQVQYAGLSLEEIERYVEEAKAEVVKYFRELDEKHNLGLQFDEKKIAKHSYSQLYGISNKNGNMIPIVVHSYKGPQYRYFDLNWFDWQLLSKKGSRLFVLTVTGLQCIPLYALPVRNINISISNEMSNENRAALLTLAAVGKQYSTLNFDFGNNMPQGFKDPLPFDYVPEPLSKCITSIKEVCDCNIPQISNSFNNGKNIPLVRNEYGYSLAMKDIDSGNARDIFDAPLNEMQAPSVGTLFID